MFVKVSKASDKNKNWQDIRNQYQELILHQKPDWGVGLINQEITHVLNHLSQGIIMTNLAAHGLRSAIKVIGVDNWRCIQTSLQEHFPNLT